MRITTLVAALALAATPALMNAQATSAYGKTSAKTTTTKKTVKHRKTAKASATTSKGEVKTTETTTVAMPMAKPETVYVKGSVTGELPPPGATLRGVTGVITSYTIYDTTRASATMPAMTETTTPPKPTLDRKVSHGAGEVAEDASKVGKKAAHGVKEAASDVKKKVTGKP